MWGNSYVDKAYWKGVARMTENSIKIDRFKIIEHEKGYIDENIVSIMDYLQYRTIIDFRTDDKELNLKLAKSVLKQLNEELRE